MPLPPVLPTGAVADPRVEVATLTPPGPIVPSPEPLFRWYRHHGCGLELGRMDHDHLASAHDHRARNRARMIV